MNKRYRLTDLDTPRSSRGAGQVSRFAKANLAHPVRRAFEFVKAVRRQRDHEESTPSGSLFLYYWANWLYRRHIPLLPGILQRLLFLVFGAFVPYLTDIGPGCCLAHGGKGVVIHEKARIGRHVRILPQVTIGQREPKRSSTSKFPEIGDDVYIGTGAKILGPVVVGSNSVIGANAVVVESVPTHCVAAGVPARIIRENIDVHSVEGW